MRELIILFVHLLTTLIHLASGGLRSVNAESVPLKHQLWILSLAVARSLLPFLFAAYSPVRP
jgi:hypothetical protein